MIRRMKYRFDICATRGLINF